MNPRMLYCPVVLILSACVATPAQRQVFPTPSAPFNAQSKFATATAEMESRQLTVEAGPLTPLPEDLYTPTPELGPTETPHYFSTIHRQIGDGTLLEDWDHPPMWIDKGTVNLWRASYADIVVFAGWLGPDLYPGVHGALFVVVNGYGSNPEVYVAPVLEGALRIEGGYGHVLIVTTALRGSLLAFDVDSREFVPVPEATQVPGTKSP